MSPERVERPCREWCRCSSPTNDTVFDSDFDRSFQSSSSARFPCAYGKGRASMQGTVSLFLAHQRHCFRSKFRQIVFLQLMPPARLSTRTIQNVSVFSDRRLRPVPKWFSFVFSWGGGGVENSLTLRLFSPWSSVTKSLPRRSHCRTFPISIR